MYSCISFDSYIKPQPEGERKLRFLVVYLLTPTSNHNYKNLFKLEQFVVYLLTPTSNHNSMNTIPSSDTLYIFWLLHQTTTLIFSIQSHTMLYIFWLLHQTTTLLEDIKLHIRCISFDSYIKPQLSYPQRCYLSVVYLLTPTSNHNIRHSREATLRLYIFWLLHQTTTKMSAIASPTSCISFDSYIKPQLIGNHKCAVFVVYLLTPTSNHNRTRINK